MIIHAPEIRSRSDGITASARIEFQRKVSGMPDSLWFKFPRDQSERVSGRADGFVITMLLVAMRHGENIRVRGALSPRLRAGMEKYQRVFNSWFPKTFQLIDIDCDSISQPPSRDHSGSVVCAFSGGVDSFFSLWRHLPANQAHARPQVTHALFVLGFDIELERYDAYYRLRDSYASMFKRLGLGFLTASTNCQQFDTRTNWGIFHGTALIGLVHILGADCCRFYIPASHTCDSLVPWGTDPRIDHLLSTEALEIVHDGAAFTRIDKTDAISRWPETYDKLRVCVQEIEHLNCGRCEKCIRTMVTLDMLGALEMYESFDASVEMKRVRRCRYYNASDFAFPREIIRHAAGIGRHDIVLNVLYAVAKSRVAQLPRQATRNLMKVKRALFG